MNSTQNEEETMSGNEPDEVENTHCYPPPTFTPSRWELTEKWFERLLAFGIGSAVYLCVFLLLMVVFHVLVHGFDSAVSTSANPSANSVMAQIEEQNRVNKVEREARDDAEELSMQDHTDPGFVRCNLRSAGYVSCFVHTIDGFTMEARCRARRPDEHLVDGSRCSWIIPEGLSVPVNPPAVDHPPVTRQQLLTHR